MGSKLTHTVSGAMASFKSADKANIESLKVYFNPVQEGTGDPSPSNVREINEWTGIDITHCGKNLFNMNDTIQMRSSYNIYGFINPMITNMTYTYSINGITTNTYGLATHTSLDDTSSVKLEDLTETHPSTGQYEVITPTILYDRLYLTGNRGAGSEELSNILPQVELGSIKTSYEPYNGQTIPITFPAFGKNLLDLNSVTVIYASMAVAIGGNNVNAKPDGSFILAAGTYTFSVNFTADVIAIIGEDGYTIGTMATNASSCTFTISKKQSIRIIVSKAYAEAEELSTYHYQMEAGSYATSYEPFDNTLYGGYIDLITGNITVTHQMYTYSGTKTLNTNLPNTNTRLFTNSEIVSQVRKANSQFYCNYCKTLLSSPAASDAQPWTVAFSSAGWLRIYMPSSYETSEQANQYFSEHPLKILIELENPVTLKKLDSIQLKTLQGQNHIWSNANGDVECTYEVIDHLNKKRITLNEPHIETITGLQHISFNTDLAAPLKQYKVNYSPVQAGSGDPSPTNIRNITGINYMNISYTGENLFNSNATIVEGAIRDDNGTVKSSSSSFYISTMYPAEYPEAIALGKFKSEYYRFYFLDSSGNMISRSSWYSAPNKLAGVGIFITVPANCKYFQLQFSNDADISDLEIYHGKRDTIYIENTYGITLYGGYVDLINGELVDNYLNRIVPSVSYSNGVTTTNSGLGYIIYPAGKIFGSNAAFVVDEPILCNKHIQIPMPAVGTVKEVTTPWSFYVYRAGGANFLIFVGDDTLTTTEAWTNYYAQDGGVNVVAKATNPTTYQLTSQQLKSLVGTNNIWVDSNETIEVKYWTH